MARYYSIVSMSLDQGLWIVRPGAGGDMLVHIGSRGYIYMYRVSGLYIYTYIGSQGYIYVYRVSGLYIYVHRVSGL